ncbi:reverse transcriptase [Caerostris darwini]|uniref:Reverse transcriptase n=1 Tax=Caerostris darwini TaxID=1538125 RepID=A0AAV4RMJ6_9ARAC|nr:reverse transcriptase [Caerostris darwini]
MVVTHHNPEQTTHAKYQLQWDEVVPPDIAIEWKTLLKDILFVKDFKISRYLFHDADKEIPPDGFSDASEKAYVANPMPTDGKLSWPTEWRKSKLLSSPTQWHPVSGNENPADLATRGVSSSALLTSVWLCVPEFLHNECSFYPESSVPTLNDSVSTLNDPVPEERCCVQSTIAANHLPNSNDLFQKYSSLFKLKRAAAYCLRFVNNCRNSKDKVTGFLNTSELTNAINVLIKFVQFIVFNNEINALKRNQALSCRSKILSLNPFLDNSGILRVGGRLRHANIAYGHKHPILLPKRHILTDLIVRYYHEILLHACPQLVQSSIQEQYWIIGARDVIRHLIKKCVKSTK